MHRWSKPRNGYFLRAESFFNVAAIVDGEGTFSPDISLYGGVKLHEQSHGESFLALATHRFAGEGLYILDEPEAALSVTGALAVARRDHPRGAGRRAVHHRHPLADPARLPGRPHLRARRGRLRRVRVRRPRRRPPHARLPGRPGALPPGRARRVARSTASAALSVPPSARTLSRSSRARGAHASAAAPPPRTTARRAARPRRSPRAARRWRTGRPPAGSPTVGTPNHSDSTVPPMPAWVMKTSAWARMSSCGCTRAASTPGELGRVDLAGREHEPVVGAELAHDPRVDVRQVRVGRAEGDVDERAAVVRPAASSPPCAWRRCTARRTRTAGPTRSSLGWITRGISTTHASGRPRKSSPEIAMPFSSSHARSVAK